MVSRTVQRSFLPRVSDSKGAGSEGEEGERGRGWKEPARTPPERRVTRAQLERAIKQFVSQPKCSQLSPTSEVEVDIVVIGTSGGVGQS